MQFVMFSKMLHEYDVDQLGDAIKGIGFDGVDLTVRPGGHIEPQDAKRDLPEAVQILRGKGLTVPMLTTGITAASSPNAEDIIATAAQLDIRLLKLGYWQYEGFGAGKKQLDAARKDLDSLAPIAAKHDVTLCLHTHSGDFLTATPAQMLILLANRDLRYFGTYVDLGHLTVEGGLSGWKMGLDLLSDRIKIVAAKGMGWWYVPGFADERGEWRRVMLPLEDSMVRWDEAFGYLKQIGFDGPVSLHSEYSGTHSWRPMPNVKDILAQTRTDLAYVRGVVERIE